MSKRKNQDRAKYTGDKNITERDLNEFTKEAMLSYFINNNFMRQIANLNDGLKPVERRILFGMYKLGLRPNGSTMKSARIVGDIIGSYHPHGDAALYESLVGLVQEWSTPFPYAARESSFGDQFLFARSASAMRYTDTKLTQFAWDAFFKDFNIDYIITNETYDGKAVEPEYLPSRYPIGLIQGTFGIASGTKVTIPSHNITEVLKETIALIKNPDKKHKTIYPDSPTGCNIIDEGQFRGISEDGLGQFVYESTVEIDKKNRSIIVKTFPYQVKVASVRNEIRELSKNDSIQGLVSIQDDVDVAPYDGGFTGLVVTFKKEINLEEVLEELMRRTSMRKTEYVNYVMIDDLKEARYGVRDYLLEWIDARREYKNIVLTHNIIDSETRIHNLDVILKIFDGENGEEAVRVVREADSREEIIEFLRNRFDISSLQARTISNMRISEFSKSNMRTIREERDTLKKVQKELRKRIRKTELIDAEIIEELEEGITKYGRPRRSQVIKKRKQVPKETRHRIMVTSSGIIKKTNKGTGEIGLIEDNDVPIYLQTLSSNDSVMVFDSQGYVYRMDVSDIPASELSSRGFSISSIIDLSGDIVKVVGGSQYFDKVKVGEFSVVTLTENGIVKASDLTEYKSNRTKLVGMNVDKDDKVISAEIIPLSWNPDILVYTSNGKGVRYPLEEIRRTGRASRGVIGISEIDEGAKAKGFCTIAITDSIICVSEKGYVKRFTLDNFRSTHRSSRPLSIMTVNKTDSLYAVRENVPGTLVSIHTRDSKHTIDPEDIPLTARLAKGRKTIPVRRGDNIIAYKLEFIED